MKRRVRVWHEDIPGKLQFELLTSILVGPFTNCRSRFIVRVFRQSLVLYSNTETVSYVYRVVLLDFIKVLHVYLINEDFPSRYVFYKFIQPFQNERLEVFILRTLVHNLIVWFEPLSRLLGSIKWTRWKYTLHRSTPFPHDRSFLLTYVKIGLSTQI